MTEPTRVLLISPSSASPTDLPPLGLLYLAAMLRRNGKEVRLCDLDSPHSPVAEGGLPGLVDLWRPSVVGVTLCSETALSAYRLLEGIEAVPGPVKVAGGPHATALPEEPLEHGFDVVVRGEGELILLELVDAIAAGQGVDRIPGLTLPDGHGGVVSTPDRPRIDDLDRLPSPVEVLDLLPRPDVIGPGPALALVPTILSSRGCPGTCHFCANQVHGRRYRYHSTRRVLDEIETWHRVTGSQLFNFCDAAFTAHRRRLLELCEAMAGLSFRPTWWCEARTDQIDLGMASALVRAGCTTVLLGLESGSEAVLARVGKPIPLEVTRCALEACKSAGLRVEVSFMLGFPDETVEELDSTLVFMQRIAPLVDLFRPLGIVVPYPGTPIYEQFHGPLGFSRWWLDRGRTDALEGAMGALPAATHPTSVVDAHAAIEEAFLAVHPISYSPEVRNAIRRCLAFRREHNRGSLVARLPADTVENPAE